MTNPLYSDRKGPRNPVKRGLRGLVSLEDFRKEIADNFADERGKELHRAVDLWIKLHIPQRNAPGELFDMEFGDE